MPTMHHTRLFHRATKTETFDDTDGRIRYSGDWAAAGDPPEYQSTTHYPESHGSSLTFSFRGNQVRVLGTLGPTFSSDGPAVFSYSLDGGSKKGTVRTPTVPDSEVRYNTQFVLLKSLANTDHTLTMTHVSGGIWFVDRMEVVLEEPEPSTTQKQDEPQSPTPIPSPTTTSRPLDPTTSNTSTLSEPTSRTSTTSLSSDTQTSQSRATAASESAIKSQDSLSQSPNTSGDGPIGGGLATVTESGGVVFETVISPGQQQGAQPNTVAIVLGVLGALLFLVVIGLVALLRRRRKRGSGSHQTTSQRAEVTPYTPTSPTTTMTTSFQPATLLSPPNSSSGKARLVAVDVDDGTSESVYGTVVTGSSMHGRDEGSQFSWAETSPAPPPYTRNT